MDAITVIDCGIGNIQSVINAFRRIGVDNVSIARDGLSLSTLDPLRIILPGVGTAGAMLSNMNKLGITAVLSDLVLDQKRPMLGICVGMQVLAETCSEFGDFRGLGWIPGTVARMDTGLSCLPLPHVGWNTVASDPDDAVLGNINGEHFYFAHSYAFNCNVEYVIATSEYGCHFTCAVHNENIYAVQFHPEKSSTAGEQILQNFMTF